MPLCFQVRSEVSPVVSFETEGTIRGIQIQVVIGSDLLCTDRNEVWQPAFGDQAIVEGFLSILICRLDIFTAGSEEQCADDDECGAEHLFDA